MEKKKTNSLKEWALGDYLRLAMWKLPSCKSKWEIANLAKIAVNFDKEDPVVKRDFPEFLENLEKCETLADAYMYYMNRVLSDVDLSVI